MVPKLIPCTTGSRLVYNEHLFSPTKKNPLVCARLHTIVDCGTFGLRKRFGISYAVQHYRWFTDLCSELQSDETLTLVAPDCDWIEDLHLIIIVAEYWLTKVQTKNVLLVPGSRIFSMFQEPEKECAGFALKVGWASPTHPAWTHSFSRCYRQLQGQTAHWTYDSLGY